MPGFELKWNENAHMVLLCTCLDIISQGENGKGSIAAHKDQIMGALEANGYTFTWEGHHAFLSHLPLFSSPKSVKMPKWEDIRDDLFEAIIRVQPPIDKEQQAEIVKIMQARGHDMGWNAIRYVRVPSLLVFN
ncbi:hypothetical protein C8A03DRAFT_12384 [Achaetomium macrosporum]|uniref:Uncharacterized protein n=1 Tax=Achaetomium macrosporum TaxID=79813 RepID=A0AAN7H9H4_9PEZI|nr:hypothetical protein C8A03DRAFT_12384 [Achaetomium macrosporum]